MLMFRPLIRYAVFTGRARRAEYWLFVLFHTIVVGSCLGMAVASLNNPENPGAALSGFVMWLSLYGLAGLALFLPWLAVLARRLHDIGQTAWWMLLLAPSALWPFLAGSNMAGAIARTNGGEGAAAGGAIVEAFAQGMLIAAVAGACSLALFVMTLLPGTRGPNRHGPDPRDHPDAPVRETPAGGLYDEARLDELFAEAKRERERDHRPVLDFGAEPSRPQAAATEAGRAAWDAGIAPARPFGRRGA
ncbi:DUF805 domain-containing protein [Brevundimonas sp.]|uniref:DUF805 domain-containing protein n=1 Tax=Brevundimonas sp. TaxID=1871086 RepID=UPI002D500739|nr:DUF805 domain-containing protein [Brevundimonas sp.]HYC99178.1 DUF805 domain-containing protein [Brevundimonas sp.]